MTLKEAIQSHKNSNGESFSCGAMLLICCSVDAFVEKPTEEEYCTIVSAVYEAFMKQECVNLITFSDSVADAYASEKITLEDIKNMSPYELLDKFENDDDNDDEE